MTDVVRSIVEGLDVPAATNGATENAEARVVADPGVVARLMDEWDLTHAEAELLAPRIQERISAERITVIARRTVRDNQLIHDADLDAIDVVSARALLARERPPRPRIFGDLLLEGHNATIVAAKKVGKSTLIENMAAAATTGGNLFGRYPTPGPMRVALLNYELDERDMEDRIRRLGLDAGATERLVVFNVRGHGLPIMTKAGRDWLADRLADHGTQLLIVDPFGAAYSAAGGESENDNGEVRRFTTALDELKRHAGVDTLIMAVHTGAVSHEEGEERARGATVLEDWPDVLMYMTKDKQQVRYIRTDGRAPFRLHESKLGFDEPTHRLMLATTDLGVSRRKARSQARLEAVITAVKATPGINNGNLRKAIAVAGVTNNEDKAEAIAAALADRHVHIHDGKGTAQCHYIGESHDPDDECPGGWTP